MQELMSSQEVISCLPVTDSISKLRHVKSCKRMQQQEGVKAFYGKERVETHNSESSLLRSLHRYREILEDREKSSKMTHLPNQKSQQWNQSLRGSKVINRWENILSHGKMMACGVSKKKVEGEWLLAK
jgi:hypothetical protein